jgi:hypothetical protein
MLVRILDDPELADTVGISSADKANVLRQR